MYVYDYMYGNINACVCVRENVYYDYVFACIYMPLKACLLNACAYNLCNNITTHRLWQYAFHLLLTSSLAITASTKNNDNNHVHP